MDVSSRSRRTFNLVGSTAGSCTVNAVGNKYISDPAPWIWARRLACMTSVCVTVKKVMEIH